MACLDRILALQQHDLSGFLPLLIGAERLGWVRPAWARRLMAFPDVFEGDDQGLHLNPELDEWTARSEAVSHVLTALREKGEAPADRNEPFPVVKAWGEAPRLLLDRSVLSLFGVHAFGVHLNGYVETPDGLRMWVARRSQGVHVDPGKLDHLVAGGQPHGLSLRENLAKECLEEASIAAALAACAVEGGALHYRFETTEGLKDDTLFVYDLALAESFEPRSGDGEVAGFELWPIEQVLERVRETHDFKFNVGPVILDFALRRGLLGGLGRFEPGLVAAVESMRRPHG